MTETASSQLPASGENEMLVLDAVQNDMEAAPHLVRLLNLFEVRAAPFTAEEIIPVLTKMFFAGLLAAYVYDGKWNIPITVEQMRGEFGDDAEAAFLRRMQTPANIVYSGWPQVGSVWFEPSEQGQRRYRVWADAQDDLELV
jgi:hypothetical protein